MASALDKQLNEYKSRPKDESGARRTKISLIYDPREASFIDADTIYQIGYQGFSKLCEIDDRFSDFGSSIFSINNIQIDQLFLTSPENESKLEKVEELLYLLTEYILRPESVQVLEYLIRQFAVNRLRPSHLVLTVLPYLETSFFVRVIQTIPFKELPHKFKFLKKFRPITETKKPIDRAVLRDMIEDRSDLLSWIIKYSHLIAEIHPNGAFVSFVGVLFTEIGLNSTNDVILGQIIETCRSSFSSEDKSLAPHLLMAVAAINEKKTLHESLIDKFTELIFSNSIDLLPTHFRSMVMAAIYFISHSNSKESNCVSIEFINELGCHIDDLDEISRQYKMKPLAEKCIQIIALNLNNEDLVRSSISILETDFFMDVAPNLIFEICKNFVYTEYSENLIQTIASHYPTCLTSEIINELSKFDIKIRPSQVAPRNLINQLSNPQYAGSLYSNPDLPFEIASSQAVSSLSSAHASENTQPIKPILDYFSGRATDELLQYLSGLLFIDEASPFSVALNSALSSDGAQIAPFFESLPSNNVAILDHLINYLKESQLPDYHVLPFALARSLFNNDPSEALQFLPIKNLLDYDKIQDLFKNTEEKYVSVKTNEEIAATILKIAYHILENEGGNQISEDKLKETISLLLNFPNICCVAPILKKIQNQSLITAVFEETGPKLSEPASYKQNSPLSLKTKRIRVNYLYYISALSQKIEDPTKILPSLYMALLSPNLFSEATLILRSISSKSKDFFKKILTNILRQSQLFEQNQDLEHREENLTNVFSTAAKNPKSREFFDQLWNNVQTAIGCSQLWRLTLDSGIVSAIRKFKSDSDEIPYVLESVLEIDPDNSDLKSWAIESERPALIRSSMPYLSFSEITKIVPLVCAYPKYFSKAFSQFFFNQEEINCRELIPFLKENSVKLIQKSDVLDENEMYELPPEKIKLTRLKTKYIISPATLILEIIPISKNLTNLDSIVPSLFDILKSHKSHHLVFPILNQCNEESADYMIKNFNVIVDTLSYSPIPHIHASALQLVKRLAKYDPSSVAKHATSFFSALTGSTVFADDTANLLKIKQLLSSILPVLSKTDNVDQLIEYFAKNIDNFSLERASQLITHSIDILGNDSYKVFYSLLKEKRVDFSLLIVDQMKADQLMSALIHLLSMPPIPINNQNKEQGSANNNDEIIEFILQITLPPLPLQLRELFEILKDKMIDISSFVESTLRNFYLQDFIKVVTEFLPSSISIYSILDKRISNDQSPLFVELLKPLTNELRSLHSLDTNLMILHKITHCLTTEQSPQLIPVIDVIINTVSNTNEQNKLYTISNKVQALCFMASSIERFNLFEPFKPVLDFAASLYKFIISEEIIAFISNATASICLLLKTSVNLCMESLPSLWILMTSPIVIDQDQQLCKMVKESMLETTKTVQISTDLVKALVKAYQNNKKNRSSIILIFDTFSNSLKNSDQRSINTNLETIFKFFIVSFANQFNTNESLTENSLDVIESEFEKNMNVQDAIIDSFCVLLTQLDLRNLRISIRKIIDFFNGFMACDKNHPNFNLIECISYRLMFARLMIKVTNGLEEILEPFYEELLRIDLDYLLLTSDEDLINDGDFLRRKLTIEALSLFVSIKKFAPNQEALFKADYFNEILNAILLHVTPVKESSTKEYVEKIVAGLTPAFASLIDSTRDDQLWRVANQKIIELTKSNDYRVKAAALQMIDKAFETVRSELTPILPELAPSLYELTEDSHNGIDQVARQTIANIETSVGDKFNNYFS